jgi:hypothetical protein
MFLVCLYPASVPAGSFDGSKPFVCAIITAHECTTSNECKQVNVQRIDCPRFLTVDVGKKIITGKTEDLSVRNVEIKSISHVDANLILQGIQKGRAWSMVVAETTGKVTLSVSGKGESFVLFGECITQ